MAEERKLRILWSSQTPALETGYAVVTRNILTRLTATNMFEVACLGWHEPPAPKQKYPFEGLNAYKFPFKLFSTNETPDLKDNERYGQGTFEEVVEYYKPDAVVVLGDLFMSTYLAESKSRDNYHLALYYPIDGAPIPIDWIVNLKRADSIICMSKYGTHISRQQLGRAPLYIPHGVNYKEWSKPYTLEEKQELKKKYFGDPDVFVFGMGARNQARKNIPAFYEAFAYHCKGDPKMGIKPHPNSRMLMHSAAVDKGWHLQALAAEFGIEDKVFLTNVNQANPISTDELRDFCRAMDVHVNTAWGEGWGLFTSDTLAMGIPNIMTAYTTAMELIQENYAGFLIEPSLFTIEPGSHIRRAQINVNKLKLVMDKIAEDPSDLRSMGKSGQLGMAQYDWDKVLPLWIDFFRNVIPKINTPHVCSEEI
jgi:glycosyltransferase involved in cell wall biosynthesis